MDHDRKPPGLVEIYPAEGLAGHDKSISHLFKGLSGSVESGNWQYGQRNRIQSSAVQ